MKELFGVLFLILGIICFPGCFSGTTEQIIGHLLATTLIGFLPVILLLRSGSKKKENEDKDENKHPLWKRLGKVVKILFATFGFIFLIFMIGAQIVKTFMPSLNQVQVEKSQFAQMIERVNNDCPIPAAMGKGQVTGIKLEEDFVTYYLSYSPEYYNVLSKLKNDEQIREGILMIFLCVNRQGDNRGDVILDSLEKYGYGIRFVITESAIGEFEFKASADEIAVLREKYQLNPHEALYKLLSLCIETDRVNLPQEIEEGIKMTDFSLEGENVVITMQVDEELYSIEQMKENKKIIKESLMKEGLSLPESHSLLDMCKISHSGLVYRVIGNQSLQKLDIEISSDEIRRLVDTPECLNVQ